MSAVVLQSLPSSTRDAARLATRLGVAFHEIRTHLFPDGELRVTVGPPESTTIIYGSLDRPNDKLIALLFAVEALRRAGAKRLVLLAPYLCYMRQDTAFHVGEAISQGVIGTLLARCVDRVITVNAHLHRTPDIRAVFPGIAADNLSAVQPISDALRQNNIDPLTVVVGPDAESLPWVGDLAGRLGLSHTVAHKARHGDLSVTVDFEPRLDVAGRPTLIVDDIVSSGGTMIACAKALSAARATTIDAVVTHALFSETLCDEIAASGIRSIRSTYSVPHSTNAVLLDELFVDALKDEMRRHIR